MIETANECTGSIKKKITFSKIICILTISFFFLILSGHYLSLCIPGIRTYIGVIFAFIMFVYAHTGHKLTCNDGKLKLFVLLSTISTFFSCVANFEFRSIHAYIGYISVLLIGYYLVRCFSFAYLRRAYTYLICFVAVVSLIGSLLWYIGVDVTLWGTITNVNGANYANDIIFTHNTDLYAAYRNYGLFWEPGVFATALIIGMLLQIFEETPSLKVIGLLMLTVLTTQSAAGYILLLPTFGALILRDRAITIRSAIVRLIVILFIMFIFVFWNNIAFILAEKMPWFATKVFSDTGIISINTERTSSPLVCLDIFSRYPVFGSGLVGFNLEYQSTMGVYATESLTSTTFYMLATFGILGSLYTIAWVYGVFNQRGISLTSRMLMLITIMLFLNKEPHSSMLITWCLLFLLINNDYSMVMFTDNKDNEVALYE